MEMIVDLVPQALDFDRGAPAFLDVLRLFDRMPLFEPDWMALNVRLWEDEASFLDTARARYQEITGAAPSDHFIFEALNNPDGPDVAAITYSGGPLDRDSEVLRVSVRGPHPSVIYDAKVFAGMIASILDWRPAQHISLAWSGYRTDLQPLDSARRGVGWLGWLPFALSPEQVPEAEICQPMKGGTFLATQKGMWFSHGPNADPLATQRAQALEHRLNTLGLLPTTEELKRGDWGRVRPD